MIGLKKVFLIGLLFFVIISSGCLSKQAEIEILDSKSPQKPIITSSPFTNIITSTQGYETYINQNHGLKIYFPPDWILEEDGSKEGEVEYIADFYPPTDDGYIGSLSLIYYDLSESSPTIEEALETNLDRLYEQYPDINLITKTTNLRTSKDLEVGKMIYNEKKGDGNYYKSMNVLLMKNQKSYVFSYITEQDNFEKHIVEIETMIDTFELL